MANEQNLKMIQNASQAREMGKIGGKKSGETRRAKKTMREMFKALLDMPVKDKKTGKEKSTLEVIGLAIAAKAAKGDTRAAEFIRDTIGEKPVDKLVADMNLTQALVVFDEVAEVKEEDATGDSEDSGEVSPVTN